MLANEWQDTRLPSTCLLGFAKVLPRMDDLIHISMHFPDIFWSALVGEPGFLHLAHFCLGILQFLFYTAKQISLTSASVFASLLQLKLAPFSPLIFADVGT